MVKGKRIGWFPKDKYEGDFIKDWNKAVDQGGFEKVDASPLISAVLAVKDESELNCIKKACEITSKIYSKHLKVSWTSFVWNLCYLLEALLNELFFSRWHHLPKLYLFICILILFILTIFYIDQFDKFVKVILIFSKFV